MALNEEYLQRACEAFDAATGQPRNAVAAAIEAYLAEMFKPGDLIVGEAIPQRDYRKEVWIAALTTGNGAPWADQVLAHFDKTFPPEPTHG